jgi:hypothetical protein
MIFEWLPGSGPLRGPTGRHRRVDPRDRERWRVFAGAAHADRSQGPGWRDLGPLDDAARAGLDNCRSRWADAQARKGWRPPRPMTAERSVRRYSGAAFGAVSGGTELRMPQQPVGGLCKSGDSAAVVVELVRQTHETRAEARAAYEWERAATASQRARAARQTGRRACP